MNAPSMPEVRLVYIWIIAATYLFAFVAGLSVVAWKVREAGAAMKSSGVEQQQVHAYYRSMVLPTLWTVFRAALIAGTVLSPLSVLVLASKF
jgi:hypothetical protein